MSDRPKRWTWDEFVNYVEENKDDDNCNYYFYYDVFGSKDAFKLNEPYIDYLEEENKTLKVCQCSEMDVEFGIHCNSCVKDRIEKLEKENKELKEIHKEYVDGVIKDKETINKLREALRRIKEN